MEFENEYSVKIENIEEMLDLLKQMQPVYISIKIERTIYKNNWKYFIRTTKENISNKIRYFFSAKEDSITPSGTINKRGEVDIEVDQNQLQKLIEIITLVGFKKTKTYVKLRYEFIFDDVTVHLDQYKNFNNLEIEGKNESINKILTHLNLGCHE